MFPTRVVGAGPVVPDDPSMVAGCRAGDPASLDQFFRMHVRYVERTIARLTGPTPDLEDLVQTTFIEAFQSFGRYRGEASLKTWLARIRRRRAGRWRGGFTSCAIASRPRN